MPSASVVKQAVTCYIVLVNADALAKGVNDILLRRTKRPTTEKEEIGEEECLRGLRSGANATTSSASLASEV